MRSRSMPPGVFVLLANLTARYQQQRFYQLRFMWVTLQALDKLGVPGPEAEELRGLYTALAEDIQFEAFCSNKKGADVDVGPF